MFERHPVSHASSKEQHFISWGFTMAGNLHGNALEPTLTWPAPNWVDPVRRTWIIPYAAVLQAVVTLMVGTRFVRQRAQHNTATKTDCNQTF